MRAKPLPRPTPSESQTPTSDTNPPVSAPAPAPEAAEAPRNPPGNPAASVRGDRSLTGGIKKAKMTEEELNLRLAEQKLRSAKAEAQYRRSEADQASYQRREQQAEAKRKEERRATKDQDMERERNRLRKLKAQGGREWDEGKEESDLVGRTRGNSSMYSRGAHGGVAARAGAGDADGRLDAERPLRGGRSGIASSRYANQESERDNADHAPRDGRGRGRGGRGGGGGGRGRPQGAAGAAHTEADFPPLAPAASTPAAAEAATESIPAAETMVAKVSAPESKSDGPDLGKPVEGTWAEEVEAEDQS